MFIRRGRLAALGVVVALAATACGSDDDDSSANTSGATAATTATTTAVTAGTDSTAITEAPDATDGADTTDATTAATDGSVVAPTGDAIKIGLANNEGAAINLPEYRYGAEAAVQYINEQLGGVNGAPVEIVECLNDASPEGSVNCANQFVDEGAVVYFAGIDIGSDAALPILQEAGVPYVTTEPWGQEQKNAENSFVFGPPQGAYAVAPLKALKDAGATKVGAIFLDEPVGRGVVEGVAQPLAGELGMELETVFVDPANPDFAAAAATMISRDVDGLWSILPEDACTGAVQAARAAGFEGPYAVGSCSLYVDELGDAALNTLAVSSTWYPSFRETAPDDIVEDIDLYTEAMTAAGYEDSLNSFATASFATMMELYEVMKGIDGDVSAETLQTALSGASNSPGFLRDELKCGTELWPSESSVCRATLLILEVVEGSDGPVRQPVNPEMTDLSEFAL
jgi:branched-chain amino acid transport system substrate-binding protein